MDWLDLKALRVWIQKRLICLVAYNPIPFSHGQFLGAEKTLKASQAIKCFLDISKNPVVFYYLLALIVFARY